MDYEPNTQQLVRPRSQGDLRKVQKSSVDDLPKKSSMRDNRPFYGYDTSAARYGVLRRMITSGIGKRWDDVYSHILTKFKRNREADRQTLQCISRYVEEHCEERVENGKKVIYTTEGHLLSAGDIYIHPVTGILSKMAGKRSYGIGGYQRSRWHNAEPVEIAFIKVGRNHYRKVDGVWYEITMKRLPNDDTTPMVDDVVLFAEKKRLAREKGIHPNNVMDSITKYDFLQKYGSYSYAAEKRQLNKKELRTLIYPKLPPDPLPLAA